ncbi:MAG: patatin-like phospholipase family protein [Anaerolineae bacterium]|nr:patatin-like phospholipase family protein [Anaerolineae bacterium]
MQTHSKRALVLSGGGGRGAYHIGVLTYLESHGWRPDVIIGTSIGAVNGATLGSGIPVSALRERWLNLTTEDVQKMRADDVYIDNLVRRGDHVFDTTPLLATLKGYSEKWLGKPWIIPEILNSAESRYEVWITAVEFETRRLVYFNNREPNGITPEKVQASCSIPLWYEPTVLDGRAYVDGGVIANTPFRKALELGATEIVAVLMAPLPNRTGLAHQVPAPPLPGDELLAIPQRLWSTFEPTLDMLLTEIVWNDYRLFEMQRRAGEFPELQWFRCVAPVAPLPIGLMTTYNRTYHIRLFRQAEEDARAVLDDLFQEEETR